METIQNYLDSMFAALPDTEEVRRAKEEILQMMEDKYNELKSTGSTENEAIGIVIKEFGNLEELKEELELEKESVSQASFEKEFQKENKETWLSMNQVIEYLDKKKKYAGIFAVAVLLCIISPVPLIFLGGLSEFSWINENGAGLIGLIILFIIIAIAVAMFIYIGNQFSEYEYLKKVPFHLERTVENFIREDRKNHKSESSIKTIIGTTLCILSVLPLFFSGLMLNDIACIMSVSLLLVIVGIGVWFLVSAEEVSEAYKVLLQEEEFNKQRKTNISKIISSFFWCTITVIYLGWSFWTGKWGITWIIWPLSAVFYGGLTSILSFFQKDENNLN